MPNKQEDYEFIKELLLKDKACVIATGESGAATHREGLYSTPLSIHLLKGESAWGYFVKSPCRWCFICNSCKYIYLLNPPSLHGDAMWINGLYDVRRGTGYPSPDNWNVSFVCVQCGYTSTFMRHPAVVMSELKQHRENLFNRLLKKVTKKVK